MPRKKSTPNRSDGRYEKKYTVGKTLDGKSIRKSFYSTVSLADCDRQYSEYMASQALDTATDSIQIKRDTTFSEWAYIWLKKYKKGSVRDSTYIETYQRTVENYLAPHFGNALLQNIRPVDINSFFTSMEKNYSKSTLHKMRLCLNGIFETAIFNDLCTKNPVKFLKTTSTVEKTEKHTYTRDERNIIFDFAKQHPKGLPIMLLLEQGLRCGELLGLRWSDFNLTQRTVSISRSVARVDNRPVVGPCKNQTSVRVLPVSSELIRIISETFPDKDDYIFKTKNGGVYAVTDFTKHVYNKFFEALQTHYPAIDRLTPHEMRHTCGTLLYESSKDIYAVSRFLGHADISITTKLYVHSSADLLRTNLGIE